MRTLVIIAALASAAALFAQDEKQIQDAIRGLGAESFEDREKATLDLKKIGSPALEALKKAAAESDDPEVRVRAKRLVEDIAKPAAPKAPAGRYPRFKGSRVSIRIIDGATVYSLQPPDGDAIEFHRGPGDKVKLVHPDGKGGKAETEAESLDKFLADHKELAATYGLTKDGIEYGGTKMSFSSPFQEFPGLAPLELPRVPMPPMRDLDDLFSQSEELKKAFEDMRRWRMVVPQDRGGSGFFTLDVIRGAQLAPVPEVLRSQLSLPEGQGVVVDAVREGSTAAAAGLKRHDVILEIDGNKVTCPADVRAHLKRDSRIKAFRGGKEQALQPAPEAKKDY